jgi:hypothetical protein
LFHENTAHKFADGSGLELLPIGSPSRLEGAAHMGLTKAITVSNRVVMLVCPEPPTNSCYMYGEEHVHGGAAISWSLFVTNEMEMSMTETKLLTHVLPPSRNIRCFSFVKEIYLDIF